MKNQHEKTPYCKAAIFTCSGCQYLITIYSDKEWLEVTENLFCDECKGICERNCDTGVIYRDDIDEENPLHMQFAILLAGKLLCDNCIHPNQLHWTKLIVHCHQCNKKPCFLQHTQLELWRATLLASGAPINKSHNSQMNVVLALWDNDMIVESFNITIPLFITIKK